MRSEFPAPQAVRAAHACLVTEVYKTGGHRTILNSICNEIKSHVIFTDLFNGISDGKVKLEGMVTPSALSSITLNSGALIEKVRSTVNLLNSLSPKRVWLFNHHQDVVAILAALIFDGGRRSVFVHHCDHDPGLGATIKFPVHLDFTDELLENCASIGLNSSRLALYAQRARHRAPAPVSSLTVATAGSITKFIGTLRGIKYRDVVIRILQHPRVNAFHHIGEVEETFASELRATVATHGIDPGRLLFAGQVNNVSDYVLSVGAHVYLSSFPIGAGATSAEIQSAGVPIIYFEPCKQEMPLCAVTSTYASPTLAWAQLDNLDIILDRLSSEWPSYSEAAIKKYTESFCRDVFLKQIERLR